MLDIQTKPIKMKAIRVCESNLDEIVDTFKNDIIHVRFEHSILHMNVLNWRQEPNEAVDGDYIIQHPQGNLSVCSPKDFLKHYTKIC